jgi:hypothetical protein
MRAGFSFSVLMILASVVIAASAESPHDTALRIIASSPGPVYHPPNSTDPELNKAAVLNSQTQLRQFMLGDSVPEDIRVCFALRLLDERLLLSRDLNRSDFSAQYKDDLTRDREVLTTYLRRLNERSK